jgi:hypothetical protein
MTTHEEYEDDVSHDVPRVAAVVTIERLALREAAHSGKAYRGADEGRVRFVACAMRLALAPDTAADAFTARIDEMGIWTTDFPSVTTALGLVFGLAYVTGYQPRGHAVAVAVDMAAALGGKVEIMALDYDPPPDGEVVFGEV